jgi:hypothetical protein
VRKVQLREVEDKMRRTCRKLVQLRSCGVEGNLELKGNQRRPGDKGNYFSAFVFIYF